MNPTKILVSLLVVLYLIFFISNVFFPSAFPKEEIVKGIQDQIYFSKNKLGEITPKYDIVFKKGVFLTEKDFESKNTLIELNCIEASKIVFSALLIICSFIGLAIT